VTFALEEQFYGRATKIARPFFNKTLSEILNLLKRIENVLWIIILTYMMREDKRRVSISKFMTLVLRHSPEQYGLKLDSKGFVLLEELLKIMQERFSRIDQGDIQDIANAFSEERFEIKGDKIRARYGHSLKVDLDFEPFTPPEFLYHGTSPELEGKIKKEGLKPMRREYVHLSRTGEEAIRVGKRKSREPLVFKILAKKAHQEGLQFFDRGPVVVVRCVPPEFLESIKA